MANRFVVVLPNGTEYYAEQMVYQTVQLICEQAVRNAGLTTSRSNPIPVMVDLFQLVITDGKLVRQGMGKKEVMPPMAPMTKAEYEIKLNVIGDTLPMDCRNFVIHQAYDRGHSAGYEEILNIARDLTDDLLPCIRCYEKECYRHH
jgi:hypothetical protein